MRTFADGWFEMELRKRQIEAELEQARLVRLARATRPRVKREWGLVRMVVEQRDRVLRFRCEVQSLFAAEPASTAC